MSSYIVNSRSCIKRVSSQPKLAVSVNCQPQLLLKLVLMAVLTSCANCIYNCQSDLTVKFCQQLVQFGVLILSVVKSYSLCNLHQQAVFNELLACQFSMILCVSCVYGQTELLSSFLSVTTV